ncbi:DNA-binding transcriptional MerR regulator/effector-binding domain-containing protein [Metabacillus crassostreae]|uniref:MerR family transcriptional regulator n=1 Tax=Metabacillus crassostreae TaxID=929098 RepID=UPI00195CD2D3|nr:MerR family transcriptional regulator [Metabacillus crassostreae]MBM7602531.1 DNA-binding transcriptional MerR regulator/effector-binding domain-containing protein [Metabacillus crassostreae]
MKHQFRIGEVAKLFQISTSTLRYYDEIGIFQPKYTDQQSSYRYYTIEQFISLDTIIFLKKNGFSIKDIQQQLEKRTPENTKELLERKLKEVKDEMERLKRVSEKIESKIATIDEGLSLRTNPTLEYRWFPKRAISYIYNDVPIDLMKESEALYLKDLENLSLAGVDYDGFFTGDFGAIVEIDSLNQEGPVKYRGVFELLHNNNKKQGLKISYLDEGIFACFPHYGPYKTIKSSYSSVLDHLKKSGYHVIGAPLEIAILDESVIQDEAAYITLLQIPVEKD